MNCISSSESREVMLPRCNLILNFTFWHKTVLMPHYKSSKLIHLNNTAVPSYVMSIIIVAVPS